MPSLRIRSVAAVVAASALLLTLTACAPPIHHVPTQGSFPTTKPKITPRATTAPIAAATKPKSDYSFGCADLIPSGALPTLFDATVTPVLGSKLDRENKLDSLPNDYYVEVLGGLDCDWADNQPLTSGTSSNMALHALPVDSSVWAKFGQSVDGASATSYTFCSTGGTGGSCQYDAYLNGTWWQLDLNNMKPIATSSDVLPPAIQTLVTSITAKLSAGSPAESGGAQKGLRPLPTPANQLITAAQVKSALALPASASVTVNCDDQSDGPWTITAEASTELTGGTSCNFDTPDGGIYGGYQVLSGGAWAAKDAIANTPGETLGATVNPPANTAYYVWTDYQNGRDADLIDYGNWIALYLYAPDSSEPAAANSPSVSLSTLSQDAQLAIGKN